ncbi:DUF4339 domain-containing protein [Flaviaesturariibacter amylovorans]|uniref:GYF domain-containing protein n=1 Tax=Flaviaesturariibacter amylovorans TaxID=1084520 RepID=A0ABP8HIW4_9BACT
MTEYFIHDGVNQTGPFSFEQLRDRKITGDTNIWVAGMSGWTKAKDVSELASILVVAPPPFNPNSRRHETASESAPAPNAQTRLPKEQKARRSRWPVLLILILLLGGAAAFVLYQQNHYTAGASLFTDDEKVSPGQYLKTSGKTRFNLIDQFVIEGKVENVATHTNYRNLILRVTFYNKSEEYIDAKDYDLDLVCQYGYSKSFKLKIEAPSGTRTAGWEVVRAETF